MSETTNPRPEDGDQPASSPLQMPAPEMEPTTSQELRGLQPFAIAKLFIDRFAKFDRRRDPPSPQKTRHARLLTIKVSNYTEKARWALDLLEGDDNSPIYYTEDPHPPALHSIASVPASQDKASITPMLILDPPAADATTSEPTILVRSDEIQRKLSAELLYPSAIQSEIYQMEDMLGEKLGPSMRCYWFYHMLDNHATVVPILCSDTTKVEQTLFKCMYPVGICQGMKDAMGITDETAAASKQALREVFAELSTRLETSGGVYLMDTTTTKYGFTAADLTLAALSFPILRPPEMAPFLCPDDQYHPVLLEMMTELRATTAGKHVLAMYKKHRFTADTATQSSSRVVEIKQVDRNCWPWPFGK